MQAFAYIVGPDSGPRAALFDLARGIGFAGVAPLSSMAAAGQQILATPLCFFLFAATDDLRSLRGIADAVRFSTVRRLRFSPLVYFAESPSAETIGACLNMGFDDIITMPFTQARVEERLARQVGQPLVYYETASYFGPDRRGRNGLPRTAHENRTGGVYRRFEIIRDITGGTHVLRDDHVVPEARVTVMQSLQ
ncbi:hypothetical protein [Devosia sediminis]|uniref:Response regulatory domain-containing protein n=1 Tax=Devosia sediminis TaxID=2798801 RepID=A0A934IZ38_9HYPH|nr:hypothetical protein [Devosia sediminis]MBJ3785891.1 hypothetical protein [Devosia sediminis]